MNALLTIFDMIVAENGAVLHEPDRIRRVHLEPRRLNRLSRSCGESIGTRQSIAALIRRP
jgi:hypothetical protein